MWARIYVWLCGFDALALRQTYCYEIWLGVSMYTYIWIYTMCQPMDINGIMLSHLWQYMRLGCC